MDKSLIFLIFTSVLFSFLQLTVQQSILKCLVCKKVVNEITDAVRNEDPKKKVQVGSFRIQPDGSQKQTQIKYAGSEIHLNEILENVCNNMDDYAQAKSKDTGELRLLNLAKEVDLLSMYELVQDPDLNRSLKYYCENFIEEYEDEIIDVLKSDAIHDVPDYQLCSVSAGYCTAARNEL